MVQPNPNETDDPLFDAMAGHWKHIVAGYKQFEDKRPVMLYDIQESRIYAYPYRFFKNRKESAVIKNTNETSGFEQMDEKGFLILSETPSSHVDWALIEQRLKEIVFPIDSIRVEIQLK
jgi:hypothetical protein